MAITMCGYSGAVASGPEIVSWSSGDINKIQAMLDANYEGSINLSDYWSIGDGRTVSYTSSQLGDTSRTWVITDMSTKTDNKKTSGGTRYNAVIHTREISNTGQYMNSSNTNVGGWNSSYMRSTIMPQLYNALPSDFKSLIKSASIISGAGNASNTTQTTTDNLWLFSEYEVQGATTYAGSAEAGYCKQFDYFKTSSNKIKYHGQ